MPLGEGIHSFSKDDRTLKSSGPIRRLTAKHGEARKQAHLFKTRPANSTQAIPLPLPGSYQKERIGDDNRGADEKLSSEGGPFMEVHLTAHRPLGSHVSKEHANFCSAVT